MTKIPEYKTKTIRHILGTISFRTCEDCLSDLADYYILLVKISKNESNGKEALLYVENLIKEFSKIENRRQEAINIVLNSL